MRDIIINRPIFNRDVIHKGMAIKIKRRISNGEYVSEDALILDIDAEYMTICVHDGFDGTHTIEMTISDILEELYKIELF